MVKELLKDLNCNYAVEDEDLEVVKEKLLEFMLKVLTLREYNLICFRYDIDENHDGKKRTYKELSELFCYSDELIFNTVKRALLKLKVKGVKKALEG